MNSKDSNKKKRDRSQLADPKSNELQRFEKITYLQRKNHGYGERQELRNFLERKERNFVEREEIWRETDENKSFLIEKGEEWCVCFKEKLKEMAEQLPPEVLEGENFRNMVIHAENFLEENPKSETCFVASNLESEQQSEPVSNNGSYKLQEQRIPKLIHLRM